MNPGRLDKRHECHHCAKPSHQAEVSFFIPDKDGNGEISWAEFVSFQLKSKKVLKSDWSLDIQTIRNEFTEMDTDSNGMISKAEFLKAFENLHKK